MIRVLIAEDQALVRAALTAFLQLEPDLDVVAAVGRGDEVLAAVRLHEPDVVLLDIEMPGTGGLTVAATLRTEAPSCGVIMVTTFDRPGYLRQAMDAGVHGFLVKDAPAEQLFDTVRRVSRGERVFDRAATQIAANPLTPREREVLLAAADGARVADIARRLHLSVGTVGNYLSACIQKTGAANRAEAVARAVARGWL